jgi:hypothetical protein
MSIRLQGRPWLTVRLAYATVDSRKIVGKCANCGMLVEEDQFMLDDAYGVWRGECPKCEAINLLGRGGRGYSASEGQMRLVLPTEHEVKMNEGWKADVKFTRPCDCRECMKEV